MLPGFGGHLISESFLERHVEERPAVGTAPMDAVHKGLIQWRGSCESLGPASSLRALLEIGAEPLLAALGFSAVVQIDLLKDTIAATAFADAEPVALVVAGWGERLDPLWRPGVVHARQRGACWCLFFNGTHLRLVDAGRVYARRHVEFDIDVALDDDRSFAALWTVFHAHAYHHGPDARASLRTLVELSERHASGVCQSLRDGVLEASGDILAALIRRPPLPSIDSSFTQALTIVYRILFLLYAEARGLVPIWHPVYRESYSLDALGAVAERTGAAAGFWDTLRAISRMAHGGCRAGSLIVTAFNGRLFAPARTPLAERCDLDDEAARRALLALTTRPARDRAGRERIAYRDLGVEQLGAVYETLLDYQPRVEHAPGRPPKRPAAVSLQRGCGLRKSTGTFYTPQRIAQYVVRRALGPLVHNRSSEQILQLRVLDPAMGSGAFLVAACAYLANAYEGALIRGGLHSSELGPRDHIAIRRVVAERCLYGVDLNPMAVQLARLSLWLATLASDRPLSFLDHHLQTGDSLLGAWLASLRHAPEPQRRGCRRTSLPLFEVPDVTGALRHALPVRFTLASEPNDTIEQVRAKERSLAALNRRESALSKWKRVADVWCARWFSSGSVPAAAFSALMDVILSGKGALPDPAARRFLNETEKIAGERRFFHWELEFPEAFFDHSGARLPAPGFDAVIGNPPWDMIRADAGAADDRSKSRDHVAAVLRFSRDAGAYTSQSGGHANRYQLFVERAVALARPGGRLGLVLPAGLATDHGSAALRQLLFSRCAVDSLVGLDNRRGVFPIHRSVRFLLVTATGGTPTTEVRCRLGESDPAALETEGDENDQADSWFPIRVTPALLARLSGEGLAIPELRSPTDLTLAERLAADFEPLGGNRDRPVTFGRELNATDDREHFRPAGKGLPIVEGKLIEPFRANLAGARCAISAADAAALLGTRHQRARLAYRDVASATNRQTLIAAILPAGCVSTHTVFCLRTRLPLRLQYFLCGLFNSFVVNYLVRMRVTTHVTTAVVERLPVPRPEDAPAAVRDISAAARVLARRWDSIVAARLNACVARLYRLDRREFQHVLDTFPLVPREEREAAFRAFCAS